MSCARAAGIAAGDKAAARAPMAARDVLMKRIVSPGEGGGWGPVSLAGPCRRLRCLDQLTVARKTSVRVSPAFSAPPPLGVETVPDTTGAA